MGKIVDYGMNMITGATKAATGILGIGGEGGAASVPSDPNIAAAAERNKNLAQKTADMNDQAYSEGKARVGAMQGISDKVVANNLGVADTAKNQGEDLWTRYQAMFQPVEGKMVSDAMNYDSTANQEAAAGRAAADVTQQFAQAAEARNRKLASMGINPASGTALAVNGANGLTEAAAKVGAMNTARTGVIDKGIALRAGVVNQGNTVANTANTALKTATDAGGAAVTAGTAPNTMANLNTSTLNAGLNTAVNANSSAGNILNGKFSSETSAANAANQADAASSAGLGQMIGMIAPAIISAGSSKKIKKNKKPIDDDGVLEEVKELPVEQWDYKDNEGDEGRHVGPYAEDVQKKFGNKAAPGGKAIDLISMNGISLSAIKALAKKMDKVEAKVDQIKKRSA